VRTLVSYLRGLDPHLPRAVWLVQAGGVVNSLGNGVVFPFAVIYLHNVRGISFAEAGFALAIGGAAALAAGLVAGTSSTGSAAGTRSSSGCCSRQSRSRSSR
jgi:sugar phosphate permease